MLPAVIFYRSTGFNCCLYGVMLQPDAEKIIAIRNARQDGGRELWFYPTIGAAIAAGLPWLSFSCPACGQFGSVVSGRRPDKGPPR
jgi:hypothetical protein